MTEQMEEHMEEKTTEKPTEKTPFKFKYNLCQSNRENTKKIPPGVITSYSSVTTIGVTQFIKYPMLKFDEANVICDFGMGDGKLLLQIFEKCDWIHKLIGIELFSSRYDDAVQNLRSLATHLTTTTNIKYDINDLEKDRVILKGNNRELIMENGSITEYPQHIKNSDVSFLNIAFGPNLYTPLKDFISCAKKDSFIVSYKSLEYIDDDVNTKYTNKQCVKRFHVQWGNGLYTPFVYIRN